MMLRRLRLQNFRQHAATDLTFHEGLTGIVGPNGAGKTTILEAIAWTIYGSQAARGTNDTIRFSRAPARERVEAELTFDLAGQTYLVVRTLAAAEVFLDQDPHPVATGIGGTTEFLQRRLGMSRQEFFNTYFTGQKELQFLAQMGPAQRGRFLSQVLGYERLRVAQDRARLRRSELRHEAEGVRSGLPDRTMLETAERSAAEQLAKAESLLAAATAELATSHEAMETLRPRWNAAEVAREKARQLEQAIGVADRDRESAERDVRRAEGELQRVAEADARLAGLKPVLAELPVVLATCERLDRLALVEERRRALQQRERELVAELAEAAERTARLEQAPKLVRQLESWLAEQRQGLEAVDTEVDRLQREWAGAKQDVKTQLQYYRERAREVKTQTEQLKASGAEGVCPTCGRPLADELDAVLSRLDDEWQSLVQDGKWLRQREEQLEVTPTELAELETRRGALQQAIEDARERHGRSVAAARELGVLIQESERRREALGGVRTDMEALEDGYDTAAHRAAQVRRGELQEMERQAARFEQLAEARPQWEAELNTAREALAESGARITALEHDHETLAADEAELRALRDEYDRAQESHRQWELRESEARGVVATSRLALDQAREALQTDRTRRARLHELEAEVRLHNELDAAFSDLRAELNARVRPELAELASAFLTELTDGRYTSLELDDGYNVLVLDEGEEKPVISGGEEDVANLVLRLAVSQMIAERAGHPLSILVLDEVFGSLDLERRENVVRLLHRLTDRFAQVILITHIETIREGLDHVVRVAFDERSGASIVMQEQAEQPEEGVPAAV